MREGRCSSEANEREGAPGRHEHVRSSGQGPAAQRWQLPTDIRLPAPHALGCAFTRICEVDETAASIAVNNPRGDPSDVPKRFTFDQTFGVRCAHCSHRRRGQQLMLTLLPRCLSTAAQLSVRCMTARRCRSSVRCVPHAWRMQPAHFQLARDRERAGGLQWHGVRLWTDGRRCGFCGGA